MLRGVELQNQWDHPDVHVGHRPCHVGRTGAQSEVKARVENDLREIPREARAAVDDVTGDGRRRCPGLVEDQHGHRLHHRQDPLNPRLTGLNSIVAEVASILNPDYEGREVEWNIADLPPVDCDPVLVKQIFQNLLANALKFTRDRSPAVIEISSTEADGQPVFVVRDNGIGFSMKYADKLFGVFQRLHRAEDFEGTGIGLATVQRIVQKHGGRVWAEAEVDRGAAFYFTLGTREQNKTKTNAAMAGGQS